MGERIITASVLDRFWQKVNKNGRTISLELGPCWEWIGSTDNHGYGTFSWGGRGFSPIKAPRMAWIIETHEEPQLHVLHHCDNPLCVRFSHLFLGTDKDNHQDRAKKGRMVPEQLANLRPGALGFRGAGPKSVREIMEVSN